MDRRQPGLGAGGAGPCLPTVARPADPAGAGARHLQRLRRESGRRRATVPSGSQRPAGGDRARRPREQARWTPPCRRATARPRSRPASAPSGRPTTSTNTATRIDPASANAVTDARPRSARGPPRSPTGGVAVWVANTEDSAVLRIDPRQAAATETIKVGPQASRRRGRRGAVGSRTAVSGTVSRIDPETNRVEATVEVGQAPQGRRRSRTVWSGQRGGTRAPPEAPAAPRPGMSCGWPLSPIPALDPALIGDYEIHFATCARSTPIPTHLPSQPGPACAPRSPGGACRFRWRQTYTFKSARAFASPRR